MDGEQHSENPSAAGGPSQGSESQIATPLQLEATAPPNVQREAEKDSQTTLIHDEGQAGTVSSQFVESSVEPEKASSAGAIGGDGQATNSSDFAATAVDPFLDALAALDRRDYATAQRLFEMCGRKDAAAAIEGAWVALGRRDYATAQQLFESLSQMGVSGPNVGESGSASSAASKVATPGAGSKVESDSGPRQNPTPSPIEIIPFIDPASCQSLRRAEKRTPWRKRPLLLGLGSLIFAACGAYAVYGSPPSWLFAAAQSQAMAGLASAVNAVKLPLVIITRQTERDEERSAIQAVSATLTRLTTHLDQIEHDYGARLDKFSERVDQDSSSRFAGITTRLDKLEQEAAAPAAAAEFTDVVARLDKLEKRVVAAAQPASEMTDIAMRLNKLEKRAIVAAPPSSPKPILSAGQKQSTLMARAEPTSIQGTRPKSPPPLLQNYSVEDVRDGIAVVDSRFGSQQVAPGDFIPGAGRVLRIERRGEDWIVLTSLGIIAAGAGAY